MTKVEIDRILEKENGSAKRGWGYFWLLKVLYSIVQFLVLGIITVAGNSLC